MINKKGFTTIELILSFTLVMLILVSIFNVIMNYVSKQQVESIKNDMLVYKNIVTKAISDDVIRTKEVTNATKCGNYCLSINFSDNTTKTLIIDPSNLSITYNDLKHTIKYRENTTIDTSGINLSMRGIVNETRKLLIIHIPIINSYVDKQYDIHIVANIKG